MSLMPKMKIELSLEETQEKSKADSKVTHVIYKKIKMTQTKKKVKVTRSTTMRKTTRETMTAISD